MKSTGPNSQLHVLGKSNEIQEKAQDTHQDQTRSWFDFKSFIFSFFKPAFNATATNLCKNPLYKPLNRQLQSQQSTEQRFFRGMMENFYCICFARVLQISFFFKQILQFCLSACCNAIY